MDETREAWIGRVDRPYSFTSPFHGREFALMLVVGDSDVTVDEQWALSQELIRQGCRYAVCCGHDCSSWDDSIDMVGVIDEVDGRPSPFVMTTWHDAQPLEEVVDFFVDCARIEDRVVERYAILIVGGPEGLETEVRTAVQRRLAVRSA